MYATSCVTLNTFIPSSQADTRSTRLAPMLKLQVHLKLITIRTFAVYAIPSYVWHTVLPRVYCILPHQALLSISLRSSPESPAKCHGVNVIS